LIGARESSQRGNPEEWAEGRNAATDDNSGGLGHGSEGCVMHGVCDEDLHNQYSSLLVTIPDIYRPFQASWSKTPNKLSW